MKSIFITATGTDVGKTFVTALLVKKLRDNDINCGYYKAALSGADLVENELIPGDAKYVCDIAGLKTKPSDLVSFIYKTAVSPHLASEIEGNPINIEKVKADFEKTKAIFDYAFVEGSGGIICPLKLSGNECIMLTDVIKTLGLDIIVVADAGLGTINYTVLTISYARAMGINVKGIILNNYDYENIMHRDNKKQIEKMCEVSVIACVEHNDTEIKIDTKKLTDLIGETK